MKHNFCQEFTDEQFTEMNRAIIAHFRKQGYVKTSHGNFAPISFDLLDQKLGLAYTSTSSYAALWVCNTEVHSKKHPLMRYIGFTFDEYGNPIAVLQDENENEIIEKL